jgi:hypothetical protein
MDRATSMKTPKYIIYLGFHGDSNKKIQDYEFKSMPSSTLLTAKRSASWSSFSIEVGKSKETLDIADEAWSLPFHYGLNFLLIH